MTDFLIDWTELVISLNLRCTNSKLKCKTRIKADDTEYIVIYTCGEQGAMGETHCI